jgi:predicted metal-binding membrane protein
LRYHREIRVMHARHAGQDSALLALGYLSVWGLIGLSMFWLNAGLLPMPMQSWLVSAIVVCAGLVQCSQWKSKQLVECRGACLTVSADSRHRVTAWWQGCHLGVSCGLSCAAPMAVLLVAGLMDARMMMVITAAITAERVAPFGARIARLTGTLGVIAGMTISFGAFK